METAVTPGLDGGELGGEGGSAASLDLRVERRMDDETGRGSELGGDATKLSRDSGREVGAPARRDEGGIRGCHSEPLGARALGLRRRDDSRLCQNGEHLVAHLARPFGVGARLVELRRARDSDQQRDL